MIPLITFIWNINNKWLNGFKIPCISIRLSSHVMPNGDVILCHFKDIALGNILRKDLHEISSPIARKILRMHLKCNDCYGFYHRIVDLRLLNKKFAGILLRSFV